MHIRPTKQTRIIVSAIMAFTFTFTPASGYPAPNKVTATTIAMEKFMIPAVDPNIQLYVRNKRPQGIKNFSGEKIVLYVHGSTCRTNSCASSTGTANRR